VVVVTVVVAAVVVVGAGGVVGATVVVGAAVVMVVPAAVTEVGAPAARWPAEPQPATSSATARPPAARHGQRVALGWRIISVVPWSHRPPPPYRLVVGVLAALVALAGCGRSGPGRPQAVPSTTAAPLPASTTSTTLAATTTTSTTTSTTLPATVFAARVSTVTAADLAHTWRPGCPVGPAQLRLLHLGYWGFDGRPHTGTMVVNATVVTDVVTVFRTLFDDRFPLAEMVPEDVYDGNDNAAAAADDTSGFNCRLAVAAGPPQWSVHAYGEAIDVNDVQNPYVFGGTVIPPAGSAYLDRRDVRPGMAVPGGVLLRAFASVGWFWGGRWTASPDYQHFSLTGG
jgi:predicted small lipoprotein YifL